MHTERPAYLIHSFYYYSYQVINKVASVDTAAI